MAPAQLRLGCSRLYDSVQFGSANGAICKERNIMSYHKAQQGLHKPGTFHPSSIPACLRTSRARNLGGPLGIEPDVCLDLQKPPSTSLSPQIVVLKGQMAGGDGVVYMEVKRGNPLRIYLLKQNYQAGCF